MRMRMRMGKTLSIWRRQRPRYLCHYAMLWYFEHELSYICAGASMNMRCRKTKNAKRTKNYVLIHFLAHVFYCWVLQSALYKMEMPSIQNWCSNQIGYAYRCFFLITLYARLFAHVRSCWLIFLLRPLEFLRCTPSATIIWPKFCSSNFISFTLISIPFNFCLRLIDLKLAILMDFDDFFHSCFNTWAHHFEIHQWHSFDRSFTNWLSNTILQPRVTWFSFHLPFVLSSFLFFIFNSFSIHFLFIFFSLRWWTKNVFSHGQSKINCSCISRKWIELNGNAICWGSPNSLIRFLLGYWQNCWKFVDYFVRLKFNGNISHWNGLKGMAQNDIGWNKWVPDGRTKYYGAVLI